MGDPIYCTLCLVTDTKMFKMSDKMYYTYNWLIPTQHKLKKFQMSACYECRYMLYKCEKFKEKCFKAYCMLQELSAGTFQIAKQDIESINLKDNGLGSSLEIAINSHVIEKIEMSPPPTQPPTAPSNECVENIKCEPDIDPIEGINAESNTQTGTVLQQYNEPPSFQNVMIDDNPALENVIIKEEVNDTLETKVENNNEDNNTSNVEGFNIVLYVEPDKKNNKAAKSNIKLTKNKRKVKRDKDNSSESDDLDYDTDELNDSEIDSDSDESNKSIDSDDSLSEVNDIDSDSDDLGDSNDDSSNDDSRQTKDYDYDSDELNTILARYPEVQDDCVDKDIIPQKRKIGGQDKEKKIQEVKIKRRKLTQKTIENLETIFNTIEKSRQRYDSNINRSLYDKYATVIELTPEEARREVQLRKESRNYKISKYKCELCFRGYSLETTYETHMARHNENAGSFECDACFARFINEPKLKKHFVTCHTYKFVCKICPYVCFSAHQSLNHVLLHKGKTHECKLCGQKFRYPHSVFSHQRMKHRLEVVCDLCGNAFAARKGLEAHKNFIHKNEKNEFQGPKCDECNVHFTSHYAHKRHLVLSSKHEVRNGCTVCGEVFSDKSSLRQHRSGHESVACKRRNANLPKRKMEKSEDMDNIDEDPPLGPCVYCGTPLPTAKVYNKHMLALHGNTEIAAKIRTQKDLKYVCEVCGNLYQNPTLLMSHQRTHTGEKPYSCEVCGKAFGVPNALKGHMARYHNKEMPYKCDLCNKQYAFKGQYQKHMRYHTSDRLYKCTGCDKRFLFFYEMKNHAKYVHEKVPWPKRNRNRNIDDTE